MTSDTEKILTKDDLRLLFTVLEQAEESITENETKDNSETADRVRSRIRHVKTKLRSLSNVEQEMNKRPTAKLSKKDLKFLMR